MARAPIRPLAWELPYAMGAALKRQKKKKKEEEGEGEGSLRNGTGTAPPMGIAKLGRPCRRALGKSLHFPKSSFAYL